MGAGHPGLLLEREGDQRQAAGDHGPQLRRDLRNPQEGEGGHAPGGVHAGPAAPGRRGAPARRVPLKILVAPNAFKGCLGAAEAALALASGLRGARLDLMPVADGGDGLIDVLLARRGGRRVRKTVVGPLGETRTAEYALLADGRTAVIEMARASGIAGIPRGALDPLGATSLGTGELIADALRRGRRRILVGLGGSASSDGGAGMARALGARLLDERGRELPPGAAALVRLARVDTAGLRRRLRGVRVIAICDVSNPLLGRNGSARVYGPQKGASAAQVRVLERAMSRWAAVLERDLGVAVAGLPGAGAAGGLGSGLRACLGARLVAGSQWVLKELGAGARVRRSDFVVTGEGTVDASSFFGKAPLELTLMARRAGRPAGLVCGRLAPGLSGRLKRAGVGAVEAIALAGEPLSRSIGETRRRLPGAAARLARALSALLALAVLPAAASWPGSLSSADELYFQRDQAGALERSNAMLEAALKAEPDDAQALWRHARGLVRAGERAPNRGEAVSYYERAEAAALRSVSLSSGSADAWFTAGFAMGRRGEARGMMNSLFIIKPLRRDMEAALRLAPCHAGAHHLLGELFWQLPGFVGGSKKEALKHLEAALACDPSYTAPYPTLAEVYLKLGRKAEASALVERIKRVERPADPAEYRDNIADLEKTVLTSR
ncbi:MAG: glycerate kinase [Elusimicrobia bacterium]|nr:glycerate kinase [Elusimicrobiota bacterium]